MTIAELLRRVTELDVKSNLPKFVFETSGAITELNRYQLNQGKYKTDEAIEPEYYSDEYASMKQGMNSNAPMYTPDLKLTGAFYEGFDVIINGMEYSVTSNDGKTGMLVKKYGEDIFGLSKESKAEYANDHLLQEIKEYITSVTGLTFE